MLKLTRYGVAALAAFGRTVSPRRVPRGDAGVWRDRRARSHGEGGKWRRRTWRWRSHPTTSDTPAGSRSANPRSSADVAARLDRQVQEPKALDVGVGYRRWPPADLVAATAR